MSPVPGRGCLHLTAFKTRRYYPGVEIADDISTESDRVKFLQSVAQVMLTKARMKLNIKRLYAADGNAVKELLKLASLLYKATSKAGDMDDVRRACVGGRVSGWVWVRVCKPSRVRAAGRASQATLRLNIRHNDEATYPPPSRAKSGMPDG
mgnify:CR=1 FL=1